MTKIIASLLFILISTLGLNFKATAQSNPIVVPTYANRSEMPDRITPEKKLLRQLPLVVMNEKGTDLALFESEMKQWIIKNPSIYSQLEKPVINLIEQNQFEQLTEILIEMGHSKENDLIKKTGGKHD